MYEVLTLLVGQFKPLQINMLMILTQGLLPVAVQIFCKSLHAYN